MNLQKVWQNFLVFQNCLAVFMFWKMIRRFRRIDIFHKLRRKVLEHERLKLEFSCFSFTCIISHWDNQAFQVYTTLCENHTN